ncbi:MAG: STAS domain-containing protein [Actinomycetia bacterium]|nr:STAS domain-containing protein [Actinomycetes bacterium]
MTNSVFTLTHLDTPDGAPTAVSISGEIDVSNVDDFTDSMTSFSRPPAIIVELSALGYLDSAGFAAVDSLHAAGGFLIVIAPQSLIHTAAELLALPFHPDIQTACRTLDSTGSP